MLAAHNLPKKTTKTKKRIGRGNASSGTYAGRGMKGQRSRSGGKSGLAKRAIKAWVSKLPKKRGFTSIHDKPAWVELTDVARVFDDDSIVTPRLMKEKGLVSNISNGVKVLGKGPVKKKLTLKGVYISASAKQAVEQAGGAIEGQRLARKVLKAQAAENAKAEKQAATENKSE